MGRVLGSGRSSPEEQELIAKLQREAQTLNARWQHLFLRCANRQKPFRKMYSIVRRAIDIRDCEK
ncbi:hypothetical protein [Methylobacterium brachythecii]|uniref:hypothetical protein n=1 Tax=Methylobacterium brachythecii TaxID=1176177 RepID=UPI001607BA1E|nr:hypothetical protein [Methylobacterium brachythecii]